MLYEFIATLSAGFAMAGMALIARHLSTIILKKQLPKWLIPLFAFIGIMGFQLHQEYNWDKQKKIRIESKGMIVIKTIQESVWYRPWSYIQPQTTRFMAVDIKNIETNQLNPHLKRTQILIADRFNGLTIPQVFNCKTAKRADLPDNTVTNDNSMQWIDMNTQENLYQVVCK